MVGFAATGPRAGKTTSARIWQMYMCGVDVNSVERWLETWNEPFFRDLSETPIVSFADPLRQVAEILTGIPAKEWKNPKIKDNSLPYPYEHLTGREFLERLGTEAVRDNMSDDCWVFASNLSHGNNVIYDDVRLPNEAEYVKSKGGIIIEISGRGETRNHRSGIRLSENLIDYRVDNSKDLLYLATQIKKIYENQYR